MLSWVSGDVDHGEGIHPLLGRILAYVRVALNGDLSIPFEGKGDLGRMAVESRKVEMAGFPIFFVGGKLGPGSRVAFAI